MLRSITSLIALCMIACGGDLQFFIGDTQIEIEHDAYAPDDTPQAIAALQTALHEHYTNERARSIYDVKIKIVRAWTLIQTPLESSRVVAELACIYDPETGEIIARIPSETRSLLDSSIPHEILEHRLPQIIYRDVNRDHRPYFAELRAAFVLRAQEIVE